MHTNECNQSKAYSQRGVDDAAASKAAISAAQATIDSAGIILQNQHLERERAAQAQKILNLERQLIATQGAAHKREQEAAIAQVAAEARNTQVVAELQASLKQAGVEACYKLEIERADKAKIAAQLSAEQQRSQGMLMSFGEAQNEAQWKRKFSHLRAEHKELQLERDHYKKLCSTLQT